MEPNTMRSRHGNQCNQQRSFPTVWLPIHGRILFSAGSLRPCIRIVPICKGRGLAIRFHPNRGAVLFDSKFRFTYTEAVELFCASILGGKS
jgi:hypothetical protein